MALPAADIALVAAGPAAGYINQLFAKPKVVWHLKNLDTGEDLEGQFAPIGPTKEVGSVYAEHSTLNRQHAIMQYIRGLTDTYSFTARFYALHSADTNPEVSIAALEKWSKRDARWGRPPRVAVTVGNQVPLPEAVIEGPLSIAYVDDPLPDAGIAGVAGAVGRVVGAAGAVVGAIGAAVGGGGGVRGADCSITLRAYTKYDLSYKEEPSTRYHRAQTGDYYELLAYREYKAPLLGDIIRKDHPDKQTLTEGDVVKLPSIGAIKGETVKPTSLALEKSIGAKDTVQRRLRQSEFERHDVTHTSAIIPEGL